MSEALQTTCVFITFVKLIKQDEQVLEYVDKKALLCIILLWTKINKYGAMDIIICLLCWKVQFYFTASVSVKSTFLATTPTSSYTKMDCRENTFELLPVMKTTWKLISFEIKLTSETFLHEGRNFFAVSYFSAFRVKSLFVFSGGVSLQGHCRFKNRICCSWLINITTFSIIGRFVLILQITQFSSSLHFSNYSRISSHMHRYWIRITKHNHLTDRSSFLWLSSSSLLISSSSSVQQRDVLTVKPWFSASDAPLGSYENILRSVKMFKDFLYIYYFFKNNYLTHTDNLLKNISIYLYIYVSLSI